MRPIRTYFIWTSGSITGTTRINLTASRRYLVTGGLTTKKDNDFSQLFIQTVCTGTGPISCGIRDIGLSEDDRLRRLGLNEFLPANTSSVIIALRSRGGKHRGEGVIWEL